MSGREKGNMVFQRIVKENGIDFSTAMLEHKIDCSQLNFKR